MLEIAKDAEYIQNYLFVGDRRCEVEGYGEGFRELRFSRYFSWTMNIGSITPLTAHRNFIMFDQGYYE